MTIADLNYEILFQRGTDNFCTIACDGKIDSSNEGQIFDLIDYLLSIGTQSIRIDMLNVTFLRREFILQCFYFYRLVTAVGGEMVITNINAKTISEIRQLKFTGLFYVTNNGVLFNAKINDYVCGESKKSKLINDWVFRNANKTIEDEKHDKSIKEIDDYVDGFFSSELGKTEHRN